MAEKKRKVDDHPPPTASTPALDADSSFRPWSDLHPDILLPIRDRFSVSIPDLLAFSSVCRSWRAAAAAAPITGPPILLVPSATPTDSGLRRWSGPPQCSLKALTPTNGSYRSAISSKTLKKKCVGCSNGHLIFVGYKWCVLADVFTGREVHPPHFPAGDRRFVSGILTAPLSSPSCLLLLVSLDSTRTKPSSIVCWKPGTDGWSKLEIKNCPPNGSITIGVFKDRILVMDWLYNLGEVEFFPQPSWKYVQDTEPGGLPHDDRLDRYLVECGEELLFVHIGHYHRVYRLDWAGWAWVKMESLRDWCLFIGGGTAVACHDPRRWGGRDDCIYLTQQGGDTWVEVPLGGTVTWSSRGFDFEWPSPVWIYPSKLL